MGVTRNFRCMGAGRRPGRLLIAAAAAVTTALLQGRWLAFSAPVAGGLNRKQMRGTIHNKDTLGDVVEVPLEEEAPEPEPKAPRPERRVPYSLHIVSQFPQHKHLHDESNARQFIEEKIVHSLENFEDLIRHVEVHLQVSENFHREKPAAGHKHKAAKVVVDDEESGVQSARVVADSNTGHKMLTPFIFKATVTLANQHTVTLANPEKHAQPTLTEAVDHMVDVLRKSLREEKDRMISARKKDLKTAMPDLADDEDDAVLVAESIAEAEAAQAEVDAADEQLYRQVEAASD